MGRKKGRKKRKGLREERRKAGGQAVQQEEINGRTVRRDTDFNTLSVYHCKERRKGEKTEYERVKENTAGKKMEYGVFSLSYIQTSQ